MPISRPVECRTCQDKRFVNYRFPIGVQIPEELQEYRKTELHLGDQVVVQCVPCPDCLGLTMGEGNRWSSEKGLRHKGEDDD